MTAAASTLQAVSAGVAGIALVVSVIVFVDNRLRAIETARLARRPALVFSWDATGSRWTLRNIGNGPALDVVILQRVDAQWVHPLRMPEMATGGETPVPRAWTEKWHKNPGLGARYRSMTGEQYRTRTGDDWSQMAEGWGDMPSALWNQIEPHWDYRDDALWGPTEGRRKGR
jgi:hypothetical protein